MTESVEVVDLMLEISDRKVHLNAKAFAKMKKLRILKIYHPIGFRQNYALTDFNVKFSGSLDFLSNELRLLYWIGCPFSLLPSSFYPKNIVAIDLSYSNIEYLWTTPKCFLNLKVMKLRHCRMLTSTPDFTEITNLEELNLEGCVKLTKLHPSIGMLKRLVVLNMKNCKSLMSLVPIKVEMESLKVVNLSGCLKVDKLPESLCNIKTIVELHINRTAITELPSFVYSLRDLESLSFGEYETISSTWWSLCCLPVSLPSRQRQLPQSLVLSSLAGLNNLEKLNLSKCNISKVPDSIGSLSHLKVLYLRENSFTTLPTSISRMSVLQYLYLQGCSNLQVVPQLPPHIRGLNVSRCTSLRELPARFNLGHVFFSCIFMGFPESFKNVTSNGSRNQLFSLIRYLSFQIHKSDTFQAQGDHIFPDQLNTIYHGNCIPQWCTNQSKSNCIQIDLPSDWCYDKVIGYVTCVVFTPKKYFNSIGDYHRNIEYSMNNFDGDLLFSYSLDMSMRLGAELKGKCESDMIWFHYTANKWRLKKAEEFVTFTFIENENVEVKECGVRFVFNEDRQNGFDLSMIQDIQTPTQDRGNFVLARPMFTRLTW